MQPFRSIVAGALFLLSGCGATRGAGGARPVVAAGVDPDRWEVPALPATTAMAAPEFAARRAALAAVMEEGVLLVPGSAAPASDFEPFNQNAPFRYLTGILEPGAALVISKQNGAVSERLFVPPRDPAREVWEGARLGVEGAQVRTGIPARPAAQLLPALDSLLQGGGTLYSLAQPAAGVESPLQSLTAEQQVLRALVARHPSIDLASLGGQLERLRGTKSPAEIDRIRRAAYITVLAHRAAMRSLEPGLNEFEVQALIEYLFRRNGAERPSFSTIVGSGPNSTALHYNTNDRYMEAGEVVVMDIGASYDGYAADITRTVPVSGQFSPEQRAIYEIVLAAQKAAESRARPGATWQQLSAAADSVIAHGLARLGLIEAPGATYACASRGAIGQCPQFRLFFMHGLGHGIGLDVHDPDASYFGTFTVGGAFTIEPGIYVREDVFQHLPDTPENRATIARLQPVADRYRNIGVRIEDDYLITARGVERISAGAPREVAEIEALMRLPGVAAPERRPEVVEWYRTTRPR